MHMHLVHQRASVTPRASRSSMDRAPS